MSNERGATSGCFTEEELMKLLDYATKGVPIYPTEMQRLIEEHIALRQASRSETAPLVAGDLAKQREIHDTYAPVSSIAPSTTQEQAGVDAYRQWKANVENDRSSAYCGNLNDLARRIYIAMTNAGPQEISAEASSRADGEASAAKKPGATASTRCQPGEAETPCGPAPVSTPSATRRSSLPWSPEETARRFHEAYESFAPKFGYQTRPESAKPWAEVPEVNKALMIAVVRNVLIEQASGTSDDTGQKP